jgi:hypothetical protein
MGGLGQVCFLLFLLLFLAQKILKKKKKSEPRRMAGRASAETATAIPFPLKPLFLAAAADAGSKILLSIFRNF